MVSLAIVGTGRIAHLHAAAAAALPAVRITAAIDSDRGAAEAFATQWGCDWSGTALADYREHLDGVIVCSPTARHLEHALAVIGRGLPVLVEKPFAQNLDAAVTMIEAAAAANVPILGAQVLRFLPMFEWARQQVAAGVLGRPVQAIERRLVDRADNFPWWRELPAFLISHWGSHSIDLLCSLFDDRATHVYCQADSIRSAFGVVDDFDLQIRFASGTRASSSMSFSSRLEVHDIVIVGTDATLSFDCYRSARIDGTLAVELPPDEMLARGFEAQLANFVGAIAGAPARATGRTVLPGLQALDAAERSALGEGLVTLADRR
jgi:predicted dehydrogenase